MSVRSFSVRSASWPDDRDALVAVRMEVFVEEQQVPAEIEVDGADAGCVHALAVDADGEAIGTGRLDGDGHIGRVAVLAAHRRRGVGTALMRHLTEVARARGDARIEISAQLRAMPFYEALGYVANGPVYLEAGIEHRQMSLALTPGAGDLLRG